MPEAEFYILLIFAGAIFVICSLIAAGIYYVGRRQNSRSLKVLAILPLVCGLIVFVPMALVLLMWVWCWIAGKKS
jgi:hypothetical protein